MLADLTHLCRHSIALGAVCLAILTASGSATACEMIPTGPLCDTPCGCCQPAPSKLKPAEGGLAISVEGDRINLASPRTPCACRLEKPDASKPEQGRPVSSRSDSIRVASIFGFDVPSPGQPFALLILFAEAPPRTSLLYLLDCRLLI